VILGLLICILLLIVGYVINKAEVNTLKWLNYILTPYLFQYSIKCESNFDRREIRCFKIGLNYVFRRRKSVRNNSK